MRRYGRKASRVFKPRRGVKTYRRANNRTNYHRPVGKFAGGFRTVKHSAISRIVRK